MNSKVDNITYLLILNILSSCKSIQKANLNFRESLSEKSLTPKWTKILIKRLVYGRVLFLIFVIFFRCSFQKYNTQVTEFANFECFWDQEPELHILCFSTRQLDSATVQWKGQFTGHALVRGQNPSSVRAAFRRVNYFLLLSRVSAKNAKNSMIRQTVHFIIYVFTATQILSRRPIFSTMD